MRLPSVPAILALEAVAKLGSLRAAAESLNITESAVSHRISTLERHYGLRVLDRTSRPVALTAQGLRLLQHLSAALTHLRLAESPRDDAAVANLTISALPSIAHRWLLPRLPGFMAQHPSLQLKLVAAQASDDYVADGVDVGLRFGPGGWKGVEEEMLSDEVLYPVAAPCRWGGARSDGNRDDRQIVASLPLLRDPWQPWPAWLDAASLCGSEVHFGPFIDDPVLLLQAAELGQGVVLARARLVEDAVSAGRLTRLTDVQVPASGSYFAVTPPGRRPSRAAAGFLDWVRSQFSKAEAIPST